MTNLRSQKYRIVLYGLMGLFTFRVLAQLFQYFFNGSYLPAFENWQGSNLPYFALLGSQILIVFVGMRAIHHTRINRKSHNPKLATYLLVIGLLYFLIMLFRFITGVFWEGAHPWFNAYIPTLFHLVLSLFLITLAGFYNKTYEQYFSYLVYPVVLSLAILGHWFMVRNQVDLVSATFSPVLISAVGIFFLERLLPYRKHWVPTKSDILSDIAFMIVVQNALPKLLGFLIIIGISNTKLYGMVNFELWPQHWGLAYQLILLLVIAELGRYWMHRMSHRWSLLWRLHAVHHSPHHLYWLNVGRFHPIEKALQIVFDVLPFILLGVSEDVLAAYFIFYAVNGFFQHSNIDVKLGWLNYLVSGPELHRWHHSINAKESDHNFGNNLIIWDLVFKTWYLPSNRVVGLLGLMNRAYPKGFLSQMKTPFTAKLDKTPIRSEQ